MDNQLLNNDELVTLHDALHYLKMAELKNICISLSIPDNGVKGDLIARIVLFLKTGAIKQVAIIPPVSRAKKGISYPLAPNTLILFGNYKNDLATRLFMKKLVGDYFHFTAFGIDWIKEQWQKGTPPTYAEFAHFWTDEYAQRKQEPAKPKAEWAYINFVQRYIKQHPAASKEEITQAWMSAQSHHRDIVHMILSKINH